MRSARAASLLGLSLVLFVLSVVFYFAWPAWQSAQRAARARAVVADLKQFEQVFRQYAHDHGDWPAGSSGAGAIPEGMNAALATTHWSAVTPIGGHYIWFTNVAEAGERPRGAIAIVSTATNAVSDDRRQLDALMQEAPTARLDAHQLRLGFRNEPVYVLEQ